jgi:ferredoxin-type protein NapF
MPWNLMACISDSCLAVNGTACVTCIEACEHDAITARPALRGRTDIFVKAGACNGCGACCSVCPTTAITMETRK